MNNNVQIFIINFLQNNFCFILNIFRLEKSANNQFQYNCWSQQKMDLLIKPFIICCADGYILDCYGPFPANDNDSKILNYIIETDDDLKKILLPNKTLFLIDRGEYFYIKNYN